MASYLIFNIQNRSGLQLCAVIIQIEQVINVGNVWTNSKRDKIDTSEKAG
jgi:hypothetical protein